MKLAVLMLCLLVPCFACKPDLTEKTKHESDIVKSDSTFNPVKWKTKEGDDYPYRSEMLDDIVYNDTIRSLNRKEILDLLGEPSYYREDKNFLHYEIAQKRLGSWPLSTKVMIVKFLDDNTIDWIKIHE